MRHIITIVEKRLVGEPGRGDHQLAVRVVADGLAVPGRLDLRGMRNVQVYAPDLAVAQVDNSNLVGSLDEIERLKTGAIDQEHWNARRHTAGARHVAQL